MLYRNLLAMEAEEVLRAYPVDGAVLMGGCDKTTPGAADGRDLGMDLPAIFVPAGPMLRGNWRGEVLGSGTRRAGSTGPSCAPARIGECALARGRGRHRALARHTA